MPTIMEGTRPIIMNMEGTRPPTGASPTQPYKCGQYLKVKTALVLTLNKKNNKKNLRTALADIILYI